MATIEESDYASFIEWFQNKYPVLYACCWQHITPAVPGGQITVDKDGMDMETYTAVINATQEFFSRTNG